MVATINIFGNSDWAIKITSLLETGEYAQYNKDNFSEARNLPWVIAEESGSDRESVAKNYLNTECLVGEISNVQGNLRKSSNK